ncbi:MAG: sulfite exporter TauE/SafE family protein [Patescibacteria group bacterium]
MPQGLVLLLAGLAAMAAGAVNALAGGGTLITFPALIALGLPAVTASVTNTVALCPGYLGATLAQARDLRGQAGRLLWFLPAGVLGGVIGGFLLLHTGERAFRALVPFLILLAAVLLALQDPLRALLLRRTGGKGLAACWAALPIGLAGIYGGYFGAGLSVIVLAALGLLLEDSLTRLNAVKQAVALGVNVAAAVFFVFSSRVAWPVALAMAAGAMLGGAAGGRLSGRIRPAALRRVVVGIGLAVAIVYLVRM